LKGMTMKRLFALLLALTLVFALVSCGASGQYDYLSRDLSSYITVSADDYSGLVLEVAPKKTVTRDGAVQSIREILKEDIPYQKYTDTAAAENDILVFRYRISYDGKPVHDLSNYLVGKETELMLSTDAEKRPKSFIKGCDDSIVAAILAASTVPNGYFFEENKTGKVTAEDTVVYVKVEGTYEDASGNTKVYRSIPYARIDLSDPNGEYKEYYSLIVGAEFGETRAATEAEFVGDGVNELVTFSFTPVLRVTRERTLSVSVTLPEDFDKDGSLSYLGGKAVTLDILPLSILRDELPPLTLEVVKTATNGEVKTEEELESFIDYWKQYLQAEEDNAYESRLIEAIDKVFLKEFDIREYPADAVASARNELEGSLAQSYDNYVRANGSSAYPTLADYRRKALEKDTDAEAEAEMDRLAKESVKEYMKVFAAAKTLGVLPTQKEIDETYAQWRLTLAETENGIVEEEAVYAAYYGKDYLKSFITYSMTKDNLYKKIAELSVIVPPSK